MINETLFLLSIGAATILGVAAVLSLSSDILFRDQVWIEQRLLDEFQKPEKPHHQRSPLFRDLKMLQSKSGPNRGLSDWWGLFELQVEQSGLRWKPVYIAEVTVAIALVSAVSAFLLVGNLLAAIAAFFLVLTLPLILVKTFCQRRRAALSEQLPDAFDQMKRSVRAGQPLITAMQQIANDFPPPLAEEFAICCQKLELGLSQSIALQELARRINIVEFQMFVMTALIQRDVGGNIAEILTNLSQVVRQRFRLAARVKALTAEGRLQALVLAALPLVAGVVMLLLNASYVCVLLDYPKVLMGLIASEIVGALWIRRIMSFDY